MAIEEGVVSRVEEGKVWVLTQRNASCENCASAGGCMEKSNKKDMEIQVLNSVGAQVNDHVLVGIQTQSVIKLSLVLYIFPIIALVLGAVIGDATARAKGLDASILAAIFGFSFLIVALGIVVIMGRYMAKKTHYQPKIVRIKKRFSTN